MTRIATLLETPMVKINQLDHPANEMHIDGKLERVSSYDITFLRSGEFRVERETGVWSCVPGDVLLSYPGTAQRVFHPVDGARDRCLAIRFANDLVEDALGKLPGSGPIQESRRSVRSEFQLQMVMEALQVEDRLLLEAMALAAAQMFMPAADTGPSWSSIERSFAWYRFRIRRVCDLLIRNPTSDLSLSKLAKVAQMSPFHLDRVFHYMVGTPLHNYLIRLRIAMAARNIREGQSITDAGYAAGFNSVSYFSRSFRKHFGVGPREYRKRRVH